MGQEVVSKNKWATIGYSSDGEYVFQTLHRPVSGRVYQEILDTGLETLKKKGCHKWLSDDRKNGRLSDDDIDFVARDWGPRASSAGWMHWAIIVPDDTDGRQTMQSIVRQLHEIGIDISIFPNVDEARQWLKQR